MNRAGFQNNYRIKTDGHPKVATGSLRESNKGKLFHQKQRDNILELSCTAAKLILDLIEVLAGDHFSIKRNVVDVAF